MQGGLRDKGLPPGRRLWAGSRRGGVWRAESEPLVSLGSSETGGVQAILWPHKRETPARVRWLEITCEKAVGQWRVGPHGPRGARGEGPPLVPANCRPSGGAQPHPTSLLPGTPSFGRAEGGSSLLVKAPLGRGMLSQQEEGGSGGGQVTGDPIAGLPPPRTPF